MINVSRKNRKDFMSIVSETYRDFAENSSIHGIKYTVQKEIGIYEKIFWVVVVLSGLLGAGYMTVLFWNRYTSNPTRTSILTAYAPNTAVPFPAVTICNINRIMDNQVEDFIEILRIPEEQEEIVRRAFPQLLALNNVNYHKYNMTELLVLDEVLFTNNYTDISTVMKKISQPCTEMIRKCMWKFKLVSCVEIFQDTYTIDGPCCSFNYVREYVEATRSTIYTPFNGFNSGLKLLLDPNIQPIQHSSLHSSGLKVMIHSPWNYPGSSSIYKIVSAGRQSYLQITASKIISSPDVHKLSIKQRKCAYAEEVPLKYFKLYSDVNCLTECEQKYLYNRCGCVPYYYPFTNKRICNITNIPCLAATSGASLVNITNSCNCPSQCEDIFYKVLSSTANIWSAEAYPTSSFLMEKNNESDYIGLFVYFSGQRQTVLYKDIITSTIYLLSSFGGVYSLFLGCSFITIVEIIYYFTIRLLVNLKILGRTDRNPIKIKSKPPQIQYWNNFFIN